MIKPFGKRKDILAIILTSFDVDRLKRCYETLLNTNRQCSIDIEIMINTLDDTYPKKVHDTFKNRKVKIVETPSNGTSARGGNCALDYFRKYKKGYDYLMLIDGDDFFYPTAFECFEKVLEYTPDIIGLQASDSLVTRAENPESEFFHPVKNDIYLHSWNDYELNLNLQFPKTIDKPVTQQRTPDRVLFMSERLIKREKDLYYPEELKIYSDYAFNVFLYEKAINNGYSYVHISNSYAYVYDRMHEMAVSKTFKDSLEYIDKLFLEVISGPVKRCGNKVDFKIIPFFKLGRPKTPLETEGKIDFIKNNIDL